jgi:hypothetical protein
MSAQNVEAEYRKGILKKEKIERIGKIENRED